MPESRPHDLRSKRIHDLLLGWAARHKRRVLIGRNLAVRWIQTHPQVGVDPDVYVLEPPPPEGDDLYCLKMWKAGHHPPLLAIEVVSTSRPDKDYSQSPLKYAANKTKEVWIFDPMLAGRKVDGGPFRIQMFRRIRGRLKRIYAGEGPVFSKAVGGWVFAIHEGLSLGIADDKAGTSWWMTLEEQARAAEQAALHQADVADTAKEAALHQAEAAQREAEAAQRESEAAQRQAEAAQRQAEAAQRQADLERIAKEAALQRVAALEALIAGRT